MNLFEEIRPKLNDFGVQEVAAYVIRQGGLERVHPHAGVFSRFRQRLELTEKTRQKGRCPIADAGDLLEKGTPSEVGSPRHSGGLVPIEAASDSDGVEVMPLFGKEHKDGQIGLCLLEMKKAAPLAVLLPAGRVESARADLNASAQLELLRFALTAGVISLAVERLAKQAAAAAAAWSCISNREALTEKMLRLIVTELPTMVCGLFLPDKEWANRWTVEFCRAGGQPESSSLKIEGVEHLVPPASDDANLLMFDLGQECEKAERLRACLKRIPMGLLETPDKKRPKEQTDELLTGLPSAALAGRVVPMYNGIARLEIVGVLFWIYRPGLVGRGSALPTHEEDFLRVISGLTVAGLGKFRVDDQALARQLLAEQFLSHGARAIFQHFVTPQITTGLKLLKLVPGPIVYVQAALKQLEIAKQRSEFGEAAMSAILSASDDKSPERSRTFKKIFGVEEAICQVIEGLGATLVPEDSPPLAKGGAPRRLYVVGDLVRRESEGAAEEGRFWIIEMSVPSGLQADANGFAVSLILQTLMENAIRVAPNRSRVKIKARAERQHVMISVDDQGGGVKQEALPALFEVRPRKDENGDLHGVGLASARRAALTNGGDLWYDEARALEPGPLGARFVLSIPMAATGGG